MLLFLLYICIKKLYFFFLHNLFIFIPVEEHSMSHHQRYSNSNSPLLFIYLSNCLFNFFH